MTKTINYPQNVDVTINRMQIEAWSHLNIKNYVKLQHLTKH